jgi:heat shock protein HslJ
MVSIQSILLRVSMTLVPLALISGFVQVRAADGFPFGMELTLDAAPKPGSKRIPNLDIGAGGETTLELWCKGGKGQFSVAGNTVIFIPGPLEDRACPPDRAQADDALITALSKITTWKRQGDKVTLIGPTTLRFYLVTD